MAEDPHKGLRILILGEEDNSRKHAKMELVEDILREMKYEGPVVSVPSAKTVGWLLKNWDAAFLRITKELLESKTYVAVPRYTSLDEVENPGDLKTVKTASSAKRFGL